MVKVLRYSEAGRPDCFDSQQQWGAWCKMARIAAPNPELSFCEDCTPGYQQRMIAQERCAHPTRPVGERVCSA